MRDLSKRKIPGIEATRGDGTSTSALEFEVSVETQIWCRFYKSKCVADIL